jgi:hypothetical protein
MTPQFKHDCDNCKFLGRYELTEGYKNYDLYFCKNGSHIALFARYGNEGWQYMTCNIKRLDDYWVEHPLVEAERRYRRLLFPTFVEVDE